MPKKSPEYFTIPELAKILGITRIAVYKKVKKEQIKGYKIGRNYVIPKREVDHFLGKKLNGKDREMIKRSVKKTVIEYGEVLKRLGRE